MQQTRQLLLGLVIVEFSVALLVATNVSAAAVTKERESQTLDLLLVTPITSRYYIWGKLRGLVSFMLPFAAVPTLTILLVVLYDFAAAGLHLAWAQGTAMDAGTGDPVVLPGSAAADVSRVGGVAGDGVDDAAAADGDAGVGVHAGVAVEFEMVADDRGGDGVGGGAGGDMRGAGGLRVHGGEQFFGGLGRWWRRFHRLRRSAC